MRVLLVSDEHPFSLLLPNAATSMSHRVWSCLRCENLAAAVSIRCRDYERHIVTTSTERVAPPRSGHVHARLHKCGCVPGHFRHASS